MIDKRDYKWVNKEIENELKAESNIMNNKNKTKNKLSRIGCLCKIEKKGLLPIKLVV